MANEQIPDFVADQPLEVEIRGQALRFYPVSAKVLFQLRPLSASVARAVDALISGQEFEERQKSIAAFIDALGAHGELACTLVLDALHEAPWVRRPVTTQQASTLFAKVDGPTLVEMLKAVVKVNTEAFRPLFVGLLGTEAVAAWNGASSPETAGAS